MEVLISRSSQLACCLLLLQYTLLLRVWRVWRVSLTCDRVKHDGCSYHNCSDDCSQHCDRGPSTEIYLSIHCLCPFSLHSGSWGLAGGDPSCHWTKSGCPLTKTSCHWAKPGCQLVKTGSCWVKTGCPWMNSGCHWTKSGSTLDKLPFYCRVTKKYKQPVTLTSPANSDLPFCPHKCFWTVGGARATTTPFWLWGNSVDHCTIAQTNITTKNEAP